MICPSSSSCSSCFSSRKLEDGHGDARETHPRSLHVQLIPDPKEFSWIHDIHMILWGIERVTRGRWSRTNQEEKKFSSFSSIQIHLKTNIYLVYELMCVCVCIYRIMGKTVSLSTSCTQPKKLGIDEIMTQLMSVFFFGGNDLAVIIDFLSRSMFITHNSVNVLQTYIFFDLSRIKMRENLKILYLGVN